MFEVADSFFCWNTKSSIRTERLLQDDVQFLDVHGGSHFQEGVEESNVMEARMRRLVFRKAIQPRCLFRQHTSLGRELWFGGLVVWSGEAENFETLVESYRERGWPCVSKTDFPIRRTDCLNGARYKQAIQVKYK